MKPVVIHNAARAELDEAIAFYEKQRAGLGIDFQFETERTIAKIQENPRIGSPYKSTQFRHYRVHRFPYAVFYWEREDVIRGCSSSARKTETGLLEKAPT